jgi:hypothetical protein
MELKEEIIEQGKGDTWRKCLYRRAGRPILMRWFDEGGCCLSEWEVDAALRRHGASREFDSSGQLTHLTHYVHGLENGTSYQYGERGELIGIYRMNGGTGVDLWYSARGVLSEERYYVRGSIHGYVRWWNGDNKTVSSEEHYFEGKYHGIFREWNFEGRLVRGFPKFFIQEKPVQKREYLKQAARDHMLPPYQPRDDDPHRSLPAGFTNAPKEAP